jgi:nicotinate-nucleotide adenylyltransferase
LSLGILGGAFNPPHVGHLLLAQEAYVQLELEVVVWVPMGQAPHREIEQDPGAEERLTMVEHATSADGRFAVSRMEIDRPGPSYTVETLRELRERSPEEELVLILGADQASALPAWREPEEVLSIARIGVAGREGVEQEQVLSKISVLGVADRVTFFEMPRIDVSSTLVRRRAAAGLPIRYLVPDKVANYIGAQSLYGASTPVGAE